MVLSKTVPLLKLAAYIPKNLISESSRSTFNKQITRFTHQGGLRYRTGPDGPVRDIRFEIVGALTWWWVLWHLFTSYDKLVGPTLPNPSEFTDEELGIPPDDED